MPTDIILEVASNHGGDKAWQAKFVESAAIVGADFIKFQSYQTKHLRRTDPQYDWLKQAELSDADHRRLIKACSDVGVSFLTTVFHEDRVEFLHDLGLHAIKVGSGESMNLPLLEHVARYQWKIFVSTGLWTAGDLEAVTDLLACQDVCLLHTVTEYPTEISRANLARIPWLRSRTGLPVGYSDHTIGKVAAEVALAMGVPVVEIHHSLPGAPRRSQWDKDVAEARTICEFGRAVARAMTADRMLMPDGQERPYVVRWQV